MLLSRVCPPARRRFLIGAVAALTLASSFAGLASAPAALASTPSQTVPYVEPPAPTPPDPMPVRPTGRLVPSEGSLFGIHTIPDSPTAQSLREWMEQWQRLVRLD